MRRWARATALAASVLAGACLDDTSPLATVPTEPAATMREGTLQTGTVGEPLADSLVVKVIDRFGNPVEGVPVDWAMGAVRSSLGRATTAADIDHVIEAVDTVVRALRGAVPAGST